MIIRITRLQIYGLAFYGMLVALVAPASLHGDALSDSLARQNCIAQIPLHQLSDSLRQKVMKVISSAQMYERSKYESFPCHPEIYRWLLESPDASLFAWKKLGATKASITRLENGTFLGSDGNGGQMRCELIAADDTNRIWYAEGSGRIGPLLPTMTIRALIFLHFQDVKGTDGRTGIKHRLQILVHYDSTTLVNKITNMTAESAGKKAVQQLELFFSGMAWYASEHNHWCRNTFQQWATTPETKARTATLLQKLSFQEVTPASAETDK
ncbi:MAG TPA: hypothetical protein PKA06_00570 [Gemmatales bacterium]|nr:hypothetical protein [Gemmatales bacterium]HMP15910.1 hypothetical protein [Gemmatales bacterium]